ncbi:MAG: hypothetical protein IMY67_11330 [Bacteroidetes bacterium]|nr:hypothetical protein [Bacteroidota bacterium]
MARILENQTNAFPADVTYPYGDIFDDTGANDGVPVDRNVYADIHQFFARMADQANNPAIVLNDLPDNVTNGFQFYEALLATKTTLALANGVSISASAIAIANNTTEIDKIKARLNNGDFSTF